MAKKQPPSRETLREFESYVDALYSELDKLAKKSPSMELSDLALDRVNRAIGEALSLLGEHDKYVAALKPFVAAGENPEVRDGVLILREIQQAINRTERKLGYGIYGAVSEFD